ncbi:MAG: histidine phosphatase family protein [Candidatus Limnocylindrales bacterium]|nr:histidine phosphatase family protein [Candidatus Limnocylindrales bacterium]
MDELLLVRHAATLWSGRRYCGRSDQRLSDAGEAAAARLAAELGSSLPSNIRIVSSPLLRARQTAEAIASAVPGATLEIDERWSETDFGIAEGLTYEDLTGAAPALAARLARGDVCIDWPGGESAAALVARVEAAWRDLTEHRRPALVVSHGGPLRIAIALATNRAVTDVTVPEPGAVWRLPVISSSMTASVCDR